MNDQPESERAERDRRTLINLIAAVAILVLTLAAIWLLRALDQSRKLEACLESGRRDCVKIAPIDSGSPASY